MTSGRMTILAVEDEPITREILVAHLSAAGFAVIAVADGEAAIQALQREGTGIDWVLTDIDLPGLIDGWTVGAEFKLSHPLRPVVYITAGDAPASSHRRASGSLFFRKPCRPADLVAAFEHLAGQLSPIARAKA